MSFLWGKLMAKGFMIFVEGMEAPKKVHINVDSAWREMCRLSELNKDKEIMIFQVCKRMGYNQELGKVISLGSHIPDDTIGSIVDKDKLVRSKFLKRNKGVQPLSDDEIKNCPPELIKELRVHKAPSGKLRLKK